MKASSIAFLLIWAPCAALAQSDRDWKLCDAEDADAALAACTRLIETGKLDPDKRAVAHDNRGVAYWRKKDLARAITEYDEAIRIDPKYARAYIDAVLPIPASASTKSPLPIPAKGLNSIQET